MFRKLPPLLIAFLALASLKLTADEKIGGYLFAHMTKTDYGHLYYSISKDGLFWNALNNGELILDESYQGHPEICKGPDGTYWLVGVGPRGTTPRMILWKSKDLVKWEKGPELLGDRFVFGERKARAPSLGAPKLFYDDASELFYLTYHATKRDLEPLMVDNVNEAIWSNMRTFVMTSKDLRKWSDPQRLFQWDYATIDVIIREERGRYYAIIKDELYPSYEWPTGKSIRICASDSPLGPWTQPGPPISPNYHEAPTVIPKADGKGWLMYHEQYPGVQYGLSTAPTLNGPWYNQWIHTYNVVPEARHGCMIPISQEEYDRLVETFGITETPIQELP
ncbi:MAG: family 43 glycosylhydrolase [Opitutales bacterium]|nr:family 43 glycosylhydrolase [Opitutales bacterium]